ncbi:MAG: RRXRR domain-containing protein, partial [Candidatus Schekmanbacteria bacterium]|nr:RRXRR domain-containing protein [Candidatus Schekmanbacteria bacterium]
MVFVLDKRKRPLMPCTEKRARKLLAGGRARVHRLHPFTSRLVDRVLEDSVVAPLRLKLDPGARTTGVAIVREDGSVQHVLHLAEIEHRGESVRKHIEQRSN